MNGTLRVSPLHSLSELALGFKFILCFVFMFISILGFVLKFMFVFGFMLEFMLVFMFVFILASIVDDR